MASSVTQKGLSSAGQAFFGSLCVGTFGLGVWQTSRYFEKIQLMEAREKDLKQEPLNADETQEALQKRRQSSIDTSESFRPWRLQGHYQHDNEFLVGPRGPPPGALPDSGAAISMSPQGYFVVTPMKLHSSGDTILVNRGWVPREMVVPERNHPNRDKSTNQTNNNKRDGPNDLLKWSRPTREESIVAVPTKPEKPKSFLVPQHDLQQNPPRLFWYDTVAMQAAGGLPYSDTSLFVTAVRSGQEKAQIPLRPPLDRVGDFKTTPLIHAGYATTWYGLSLAGWYMTRMLMRR